MEFFINNNKADITIENEKTVGDVLKAFELECSKSKATTTGIILNGKTITAASFDDACKQPLEDSTKLEFTVVSLEEVKATLRSEAEQSVQISEKLLELPVKLQTGKDSDASNLITMLADFIDGFCRTTSLSALFPEDFENFNISNKSIGDFFSDFTHILEDFKQAIEAKDFVLMGDLAEYEISPRLIAIADAIKEL